MPKFRKNKKVKTPKPDKSSTELTSLEATPSKANTKPQEASTSKANDTPTSDVNRPGATAVPDDKATCDEGPAKLPAPSSSDGPDSGQALDTIGSHAESDTAGDQKGTTVHGVTTDVSTTEGGMGSANQSGDVTMPQVEKGTSAEDIKVSLVDGENIGENAKVNLIKEPPPESPHEQDATKQGETNTTVKQTPHFLKEPNEPDDVFAVESISHPDEPLSTITKSESISSTISTFSTLTLNPDDEDDVPPLIAVARDLDIKALGELLKDTDKAFVNQTTRKGNTALHEMMKSFARMSVVDKITMRKTVEDMIVLFREKGLDVNAVDHGKKKQSALHIIAEQDGNDDVIKMLLAVGMRVNLPNGAGETALHKAVIKVHISNIEVLLQGGADPNLQDKRGQSPLHLAAKSRRHLPVLQMLLRCGADTELKDTGGRMPLHVAAKLGRADIVRELVNIGATINSLDRSGQTPLHLAATHDITGLVMKELLDRPATRLDICDGVMGETALHKIIRYETMENFKLLTKKKKKINVNLRDHNGDTALHKASHFQSIMVWKTLLAIGGDLTLMNNSNLTPVHLAQKAKNHVALALIDQYSQPEE